MKNYVQLGNIMEVPAAASAVMSGQLVVLGAMLAVANHGAAQGEPFNAALTGVYTMPKVAGSALAQGEALMWDVSAQAFTAPGAPAVGDVTGAGVTAFAAAASADATVLVRFAGVPGVVKTA